MCPSLVFEPFWYVYKFFAEIHPGEWLMFLAEVAVAAVIYLELEHNRQMAFLAKATGKTSDQERRDIYAVYLALSAELLKDRAEAFKKAMFADRCLKRKCDNEIALFNEIGFMISPWIARKKALVDIFPHAPVYIWLILRPYVLQRRDDTGPYFARHYFHFTERCLGFVIKQGKELHLRRTDGSEGYKISLDELREMQKELRSLI
jgi:hypothetical protein